MNPFFSTFANLLNGATAKEASNATKEAVDLMLQLANAKAQYFEITIADLIRTVGTTENATVPIESVVAYQSEIYVMNSVDTSAISGTVQSVVDVVTGDSVSNKQNIASMVSKIVSGILEVASGRETVQKKYIVYTEGLSIIRLDINVWTKEIPSSSLMHTLMQRIMVLSLFKSTVDIRKVKINTFLTLYQHQLTREAELPALKVQTQLEEAKKVFLFYQPMTP